MSYKKYNIVKGEKYETDDGSQKTRWKKVGDYIEFQKEDGTISRIVEIPAIGLKAQVFPQFEKD